MLTNTDMWCDVVRAFVGSRFLSQAVGMVGLFALTVASPHHLETIPALRHASGIITPPLKRVLHEVIEHGPGESHFLLDKLMASLLLFFAVILGCCLPFVCDRLHLKFYRNPKFQTAISCFSAGALLGLILFHLLPEMAEDHHGALTFGPAEEDGFNIGWVLLFLGFMVTMLIERLLNVMGHDTAETPDPLDVVEAARSGGKPRDHEIEPLASDRGHHRHTKRASLTTVVLSVVCLGVHSFHEGFVVGTLHGSLPIWVAAAAIAGHKWAVALVFTVFMVGTGSSTALIAATTLAFAIASPVGIVCGHFALATGPDWIQEGITAVALGAFLYLVCELLFHDKTHTYCKSWSTVAISLISVMAGGLLLLALALVQLSFVPEH